MLRVGRSCRWSVLGRCRSRSTPTATVRTRCRSVFEGDRKVYPSKLQGGNPRVGVYLVGNLPGEAGRIGGEDAEHVAIARTILPVVSADVAEEEKIDGLFVRRTIAPRFDSREERERGEEGSQYEGHACETG